MKHRLAVWIAFAALALRLVAPLAAYAAPMELLGICSTGGTASEFAARDPSQAPSNEHSPSHCADHQCCASALALPAAFVLTPFVSTPALARKTGGAAQRLARTTLLPPPRGPPSLV